MPQLRVIGTGVAPESTCSCITAGTLVRDAGRGAAAFGAMSASSSLVPQLRVIGMAEPPECARRRIAEGTFVRDAGGATGASSRPPPNSTCSKLPTE